VLLYSVNNYVGAVVLAALDVGGSMFIHTFGAYFGLACSFFINLHSTADLCGSSYSSDTFSLIGTLFLWVLWPSFNSATALPQNQMRAVINTVMSLCSSCFTTFLLSRILRKNRKIEMEDIQNATLAGGIAIGASADLITTPGGAILVGVVAATVSMFGFTFIGPFLKRRLRLQDSCGVHNLHGMPGIVGGLVSVFVSAIPKSFESPIFPHGGYQWVFQLAALGVTLAIAITGGCVVGLITFYLPKVKRAGYFYSDVEQFHAIFSLDKEMKEIA